MTVKPSDVQMPEFFAADSKMVDEPSFLKQTKTSSLSTCWWEEFGDKDLNELVQRVELNNNQYKIALNNYKIAQTYLDESKASKWPLVGLNYGFSRNRASSTLGQGVNSSNKYHGSEQLLGSVSYEFDFWNRVGNSVGEAEADLSSSEADAQILRLSLVSQCVAMYWQLLGFDLALENLYKQKDLTEQLIKLTQVQFESHLINAEPIEEAVIQLEQILSVIQATIKAREITVCTLAYLAGEYPESFELKKSQMWPSKAVEDLVPAGLSSKILLARPDIQQAYWQLVSSGYVEKQNLANYFPNITLTGNYGFSTTELDSFLKTKSLAGSLGFGLFQPLLNYGAINAEYERSKIQYESACLAYSDCIKAAFQEVDQALIAYKADYEALESNKRQLSSSLELYFIARAKEQAGLLDGVGYISYELNLLKLEYNWIGQRVLLLQDVVQLYKVLGLGFNKNDQQASNETLKSSFSSR